MHWDGLVATCGLDRLDIKMAVVKLYLNLRLKIFKEKRWEKSYIKIIDAESVHHKPMTLSMTSFCRVAESSVTHLVARRHRSHEAEGGTASAQAIVWRPKQCSYQVLRPLPQIGTIQGFSNLQFFFHNWYKSVNTCQPGRVGVAELP